MSLLLLLCTLPGAAFAQSTDRFADAASSLASSMTLSLASSMNVAAAPVAYMSPPDGVSDATEPSLPHAPSSSTKTPAASPTPATAAPARSTTTSQTGTLRSTRSQVPFWEVRLTMSDAALPMFSSRRFRRYLAIELEEAGHVGVRAQGPLGDHVAIVWIDIPEPNKVLIQVRAGAGKVASRVVVLRSGLRSDVVSRLIAIATAELVRAQVPQRTGKKLRAGVTGKKVVGEQDSRALPAVLMTGSLRGVWVPSATVWLAGSSMQVSFRLMKTRQYLQLGALGGDSKLGPMRWLEAGIGADRAFWWHQNWRTSLGARVDAVSVWSPRTQGGSGSRDQWTARAVATASLEHQFTRGWWLGLGLEPGFVVVPTRSGPAESESVKGSSGGVMLSLTYEKRLEACASKTRVSKVSAR